MLRIYVQIVRVSQEKIKQILEKESSMAFFYLDIGSQNRRKRDIKKKGQVQARYG